ncbi:hypothetical protein G7009_02015 [Pseudomonas capeferrum]|uniref:hypothetical protein n=1 Tax=Pseudomonas capeferrum TaxID=1495066 RepID=UPI0015E2CC4A|nr:hypothetical protein [Pseudomonas capeferrum]MBA1200573.1 hypothetical protein [Pseudomonas capeferrum]
MRVILAMAATVLLTGCVSSTMEATRSGSPSAQMDSRKSAELIAQCVQFSWQDEAVFGVDASGYLESREQGGFTVHSRDAESFVDIVPKSAGTRVDYYAQKNDSMALRRKAAAATCL